MSNSKSLRRGLLPAGLAIAISMPCSAETWICFPTDVGRDLLILSMNGELLTEQPHGTVRYNVVQNNELALVAEHHDANSARSSGGAITTVLIDKRSNMFEHRITQSGSGVGQRTGKCRGFDEGQENSASDAGFVPRWELRDAEVRSPRR